MQAQLSANSSVHLCEINTLNAGELTHFKDILLERMLVIDLFKIAG